MNLNGNIINFIWEWQVHNQAINQYQQEFDGYKKDK